MKFGKLFATAAFCSSTLLALSSNAADKMAMDQSMLMIKNDSKSELSVMVDPGDGKMVGSSSKGMQWTFKPGESKNATLDKKNMPAKTFTVWGKAKVMSGKCEISQMGTNYNIVFTDGSAGGIVCSSEVVAADAVDSKMDKMDKSGMKKEMKSDDAMMKSDDSAMKADDSNMKSDSSDDMKVSE